MTFGTMGLRAVLRACPHTFPGSSAVAPGGEEISDAACGNCLSSWTHMPAAIVCSRQGPLPLDNSPWAPSLGLVQALDLQWAGI